MGCKVCTIACPFGTVNYNADSGKVIKCDLCGGDPECAKACPTRGHHLRRRQREHGFDRMRAWAEQDVDPNRRQPNACKRKEIIDMAWARKDVFAST